MQVRQVKIDSKGRVSIPSEFRESLGEEVILEQRKEGILMARAKSSRSDQRFSDIITSKPERTGTPENWSPSRMKRIWNQGV